MSKEKTAMQMLIEELSQRKDSNTVRMVIAMIKANYLKKEQDQIEKAFSEGYQEAIGEECGHASRYKGANGVDYYESEYGGQDVDR